MGVNSLPKTVTRQRRDCDLNPGPLTAVRKSRRERVPWGGCTYVRDMF